MDKETGRKWDKIVIGILIGLFLFWLIGFTLNLFGIAVPFIQ